MGLFHAAVVSSLDLVPHFLMRRLAGRYIAGERVEEALDRMEALRARGYPSIIDVLGEDVRDEAEARAVVQAYREASDGVAARGLDAYVSVKPTHVGLTMSEDLCFDLYSEIAQHAAGHGQFLRVEMEDASTTDGTLRVYERLRAVHANVGIVLQARLFRTPDDVAALSEVEHDVRLVKGIYLEPAEIAHTEAGPIRDALLALARQLWERGAKLSLATHDAPMAEDLLRLARELEVGSDRYEFQVLLGVQEGLWERWKQAGHQVRVYVPYGPEWRAYSTRRLRHNPQILGHVMRATFGLS